jgi:hypothetical protein
MSNRGGRKGRRENHNMAQRTWEVDVQGIHHTVNLKHGYWSGRREIFLDGQPLVKDRHLIDKGSQHPFSIDGRSCELGITTNGITYDYYLLLDGQPVDAVGRKPGNPSKAARTAVSELEYWRRLAEVSALSYHPVAGEQGFWRHRLIGYVRGYLVVVKFGVIPNTIVPAIWVGVRYAPLSDPGLVKPQVKAELIEKRLTNKKHFIRNYVYVEREIASVLLPYQPKKQTPEDLSSKIYALMDTLSKHTRPLTTGRCEGITCKLRVGPDLHLVIINAYPTFLCAACIDNIHPVGDQSQAEYQNAPPGLGRGILAGVIAAIAGGILWAVVAVFLDRIFAALAVVILVAVVRSMSKVGAKPTRWSILLAGLIGLAGVVFGVYLSFVLLVIKNLPGRLPLEILQTAWRWTWEEKRVFYLSIFYGLLGIVPYSWLWWSKTKKQLALVFKPEVEILSEFPV